jgi:iron complex transport system substrate-binding protein
VDTVFFSFRRRGLGAILVLASLLAACTAGAPATIPPDATGSIGPGATATPTPQPSPSPSPGPAFPLSLTDDEGTKVEIAAEPATIVSLTPAATETLFALGVGDRIVGKAEDFFVFPPEAAGIPDVARFNEVDIEKITSLEPDVVIAGGNFFTPPEAISRMRELGMTVVVVYAPTVQKVFDDIALIGDVAGRSEEADEIVERMKAEFDAVAAAVKDAPRPRVFYELDATGAIYGPADDSFLAEMIELAGADPITTGSPDKFDISVERLIEADPELILLADAPFGMTPEQVKARPGWNVMTAVQTGDIRPIDDQTITRPGPRLSQGLRLLATTIHPEAAIPSTEPIPAIPVP